MYVFLKFSKLQVTIIVIIFFFLHFLISYEWWIEKFNFLSFFERKGFPSSSAWAYIISLITLIWAILKIFKGNFPLSNRETLIKYYESLLMRNDTAFLSELIEKYHIEGIKEFLRAKKAIIIPNETGMWMIDRIGYNEEYKKAINTTSKKYGNDIYDRIILNDKFIDSVTNDNPHIFASIIQELNSVKIKEDEFVNRFLKILTLNKNGNFFREIRNNRNFSEFNAYAIEERRPILYSLFSDINVASINHAWWGIAEQAIIELQEEAKKEFSPLRETEREQDHDTVWNYRITIAIWYFDIMVREAIRQNVNNHMWMYYYGYFIKAILNNMKELPPPQSTKKNITRNFDLIEGIFSKMKDWKELAIKSKHYGLTKDIYNCIGQCIYEISISEKLNDKDKNDLMNPVWEDLIKTFAEKNSEIEEIEEIEKIVNLGFEMFKSLTLLFSSDNKEKETKLYLKALNKLWTDRDKIILEGLLGERADKFKTEIIDKLISQNINFNE
jgi:hypothetical protein